MTLPEAYKTQVQHIQESSKFQLQNETRQATPFPGYTLITPTADEAPQNSAFYDKLATYQQQLIQLPIDHDLIVPVPAASFHLTLADLIWDHAYTDACEKNPNFEQELRACCAEIFQQYQQSITPGTQPIYWQILGLVIMPRAVGVCLVPKNEKSYEQIIQLRRKIYQNPQLIALGIEQHYHLTAHITLGYFGDISPDLDRNKLSNLLWELNQQWLGDSPEFLANRVELRKFDDMTRYYREPDWPSLDF